jgi:transcriptional regulator with XRE-family HTH domain
LRRNLKRFRGERKMTQEQAGVYSGVPVDNIRRYERGTGRVDAVELRKLGAAYGHRMEDFYLKEPPPSDPTLIPPFILLLAPGLVVGEHLWEEAESFVDAVNRRAKDECVGVVIESSDPKEATFPDEGKAQGQERRRTRKRRAIEPTQLAAHRSRRKVRPA